MAHATVEGGIACVVYGPDVPPSPDADDPVTDSVRVVLVTGSQALAFFDNYRSSMAVQVIPRLGDQAFYDGTASLSVLKSDEYSRVAAIGVPDVLTAEEALAKDALPRM